jgi:hypothetical protein
MLTSNLTRKQFISGGLAGGLGLVAGSSMLGLAAKPAVAQTLAVGEFHAIFTTFGLGRHPNAYLDVGVDTSPGQGAPLDVLFNVYNPNGGQISEFTVSTDAQTGFASSAADPNNSNLFSLTNGGPGLVRARVPQAADTSAVVLTQGGKRSRLVGGVVASTKTDGTALGRGRTFGIVVGTFTAAVLLVANLSGTDVGVDVFVGTNGPPGTGKYTTGALNNLSLWRVDLQPSDQNSHLVVAASGGDIIVQLVVDDGKVVYTVPCLPS